MNQRRVWAPLFALALGSAAFGAGAGECLRGDCVDGFGTGRISAERTHRGIWSGGIRHGYGTEMARDSSEIWRGQFRDGSINGSAVYVSGSGAYYAGAWREGRWHGYGVYTYPDGSRYRGFFVDGARHGSGELSLASGARYSGAFESGHFQGEGILTIPGLLRYEGSWSGGAREGSGNESFMDGTFRYLEPSTWPGRRPARSTTITCPR